MNKIIFIFVMITSNMLSNDFQKDQIMRCDLGEAGSLYECW